MKWKVDPEGIITVDFFGRVEAISLGNVSITVTSTYNTSVSDSKTIQVVEPYTKIGNSSRIVNYVGPPVKIPSNLQKIVLRFTK